ncbi:urocanate hydratase [Sporosarcina newyorkensis]|uniref:Urocanate hydratase n=1 Tax=Sporosarcina newyorkensis TaxID=759851 RepID=A0A1T4YZ57_9BACL|nr:urocanate hydratase [Sporosarcina newyorkensis]SKB07062.1 urocanate hydratase [Sporosarcina newyorkensis]
MSNILISPTGHEMSCKSWEIEGLLRLFLNSIDPRVAESGKDLIVYGGRGKAARNHKAANAIIHELRQLNPDETLLIQSGKPVGKFKSFPNSPRIVNASSVLVPHWSTDEEFSKLNEKGLTMYGQSTAASWAYIGVQGVLQGTFETMGEIAKRHFDNTLQGKILLTSGLGGMGAAQPLSVTMHGGVCIIVEISEEKINQRLKNNYCDIKADTLEEAIRLAQEAVEAKKPLAIALMGNVADRYREALNLNFLPDIVTDQTSVHDLQMGYIPSGLDIEQAKTLRKKNPALYYDLIKESLIQHVGAMVTFKERGAIAFEYGNNLRKQAYQAGFDRAFELPGFASEYLRAHYCEGRGPCRWIALSGNPNDIYKIDEVILEEFEDDKRVSRWIEFVQEKIYFYGLPARTCWLDYKERERIGVIINEMVRSGELSAPIAITRDHSEGSTMAAPFRETENMADGSDMVADWPILNAMLNASAGASMVSIQNGGGVGIGNSVHSGMTVIADGSEEASERLRKVLVVDPGMSIIRHADAGYEDAITSLDRIKMSKR